MNDYKSGALITLQLKPRHQQLLPRRPTFWWGDAWRDELLHASDLMKLLSTDLSKLKSKKKIVVIFPSLLSCKRKQFHSVNGAQIFTWKCEDSPRCLARSILVFKYSVRCTRIYQCRHNSEEERNKRYMKQPSSKTCERSRGHFRLSV